MFCIFCTCKHTIGCRGRGGRYVGVLRERNSHRICVAASSPNVQNRLPLGANKLYYVLRQFFSRSTSEFADFNFNGGLILLSQTRNGRGVQVRYDSHNQLSKPKQDPIPILDLKMWRSSSDGQDFILVRTPKAVEQLACSRADAAETGSHKGVQSKLQ